MQKTSIFNAFMAALWVVLSLIGLGTTQLKAQSLSNLRCKWLTVKELTKPIDTLSIVPNSFVIQQIKNNCPPPLHLERGLGGEVKITYNPTTNQINVTYPTNCTPSPNDSLLVCYRVLPFLFTQKHYHRSQQAYDSGLYSGSSYIGMKTVTNKPDERVELFKIDGLTKNGSLTRGISAGNRQDVFVNSALNLQLDGKISEDLHLTAVLSDQNVPFQPEGNTQNIQQFDRIFIRLTHPYATLSAGDIVFQQRNTYFLQYYKNILGGMLETNYNLTPQPPLHLERGGNSPPTGGVKTPPLYLERGGNSLPTSGGKTPPLQMERGQGGEVAYSRIGFSIAKGRFHSQWVDVQEGVQGAYRLRGANNERFIVVMANSEKVYLDGRLLQRGFNYDYVIDYNTAEITFTNQIVITRYSRVRVDFEYSVQNYSRSILIATHEQQLKKWRVSGNFYREKDDESNPLLQTLTAEDFKLLREAGDTATAVFSNGAVYVKDYQADRVLYFKKDTVVNGNNYRIFQRATQQYDSLFSVVFSEVGLGKGDYQLGSPTANGRTYTWVAPKNGVPQGSFSPIRLLIPPNQKQLITLGSTYQFTKKQQFFGEVAFSKDEKNLFATNSTQRTNGQAYKVGVLGKDLIINFLDNYKLQYQIDYEHTNANFSPIDRFRAVEFDRDWSALNTAQKRLDDHIAQAQLQVRKDAHNFLEAKFTYRNRSTDVNGFQQNIAFGQQFGKLYTLFSGFLMHNQQATTTANWYRWVGNVFYKTKPAIIGYQYQEDRNTVRKTANDSLQSTTMNFYEHKIYVKNGDSTRWQFLTDYAYREDNAPLQGILAVNTIANTLNISAKRQQGANLFNFVTTYRNLQNVWRDTSRKIAPNEETIMLRIDFNRNFWKDNIKSELTLATAAGRELRREFRFILVNTGTGTHTWRDDNKDGIQQLNEFYLAINPDERNYIKVFTPTDEYVPTYSNNLSYRLNINLPKKWQEKTNLLRLLGKLSNQTSWSINKKIIATDLVQRFIPFAQTEDAALQARQEIFRSTFFYNRTSPHFGVEFTVLNSAQKQLLTNGFEARNIQEYQATIRYNLTTFLNAKLTAVADQKQNLSDFMENRNYLIVSQQLKPEINFQPNPTFRLTGNYVLHLKRNRFTENSQEQATLQQLSVESRWAKASKRTVMAQIRFTHIKFEGEANTPVGYELLEALQRGVNWNWSLQWQQQLVNGLQLSLQYDGRKSEGQPVAHLGRVQVTALF